jgi:FAD/FMN-containing dehydrogenase
MMMLAQLRERHPGLIVRCADTADVVAAVRFARTEGPPIAVRGGEHSVAGFSTYDDGVVVDLTQMCAVHVDARTGRARAQGGTTWKQFDRETQLYGLATTGGLISSTGLGGFTLGGHPVSRAPAAGRPGLGGRGGELLHLSSS